jgi:hypothetical protein
MIAVAAVTGVAALALAGWGLAPRTDSDGRSLGPRMAISLVAPREPEIAEGEVLEVGALSDGFDRAVLDRVAEPVEDPTWMPPDAYAGPNDAFAALPRMPTPRPVTEEDFRGPPPAPPEDRSPLRDGSRWFGLDRMRAEAAGERAERRERRAEQDAMEWRERAERRDRYDRPSWGEGPIPRDRDDDRDRRDREYGDAPRSTGPVPYYAQPDDYSSE